MSALGVYKLPNLRMLVISTDTWLAGCSTVSYTRPVLSRTTPASSVSGTKLSSPADKLWLSTGVLNTISSGAINSLLGLFNEPALKTICA